MIFSSGKNTEKSHHIAAVETDTRFVMTMRLVLALSVLLATIANPSNLQDPGQLPWLIFSGYALYCFILSIVDNADNPWSRSRVFPWIDIIWYTGIVYFTGGVSSDFFLLYLFSIFIASFRHGLEEGTKVTIASAGLFIASSLFLKHSDDLAWVLLRTTFLIVFGYMGAYWGESIILSKRRLALFRDVSRLSNPRFGVDHTTHIVLGKISEFFQADSCILVMHDKELNKYLMRTIKRGQHQQSTAENDVSRHTVSPLMQFSQNHILLYAHSYLPISSIRERAFIYNDGQWLKHDFKKIKNVADLLEARSYISVPIGLNATYGRLYLTSAKNEFNKSDALFLNQLTTQAFAALETIELVDRIASDAAMQERKKIACDLHDITVQPYVGLKLGLSALRLKAQPDNPLIHDLDKLTTIANDAVSELRNYAGNFKNAPRCEEPVFIEDLKRHIEKLKKFYGIHIDLLLDSVPTINDRLAAEVLHLLKEGLSNIRKHTDANHGSIKIHCDTNWLKIQIENECKKKQTHKKFSPRSIQERISTLGGTVDVIPWVDGKTAVNIEIPL